MNHMFLIGITIDHSREIIFILDLVLCMNQQMLLHIGKLRVALETNGALVRLQTVVDHLVLFQIGPLCESPIANLAFERLVARVQELMLHHIGLLRKGLFTDRTPIWLEPVVDKLVTLQIIMN